MDSSNRTILVLLGLPVVALVAALGLSGQKDKSQFDRLKVGMTTAQVRAIVDPPRSRKFPHRMPSLIDDDCVVTINERMVLVMEDGRLVHKEWLEKEKK